MAVAGTIPSATSPHPWPSVRATVPILGARSTAHEARQRHTASISSEPHLLAYAATKGAIYNFTAGLAQLLAEKGIRANAVAPGPIWTPLIPSTLGSGPTITTSTGSTGQPSQNTGGLRRKSRQGYHGWPVRQSRMRPSKRKTLSWPRLNRTCYSSNAVLMTRTGNVGNLSAVR